MRAESQRFVIPVTVAPVAFHQNRAPPQSSRDTDVIPTCLFNEKRGRNGPRNLCVELVVFGETIGGFLAHSGPFPKPIRQIRLMPRFATAAHGPSQTVLPFKGGDVGQPAVQLQRPLTPARHVILLNSHTFSAPKFRHLRNREHQETAVFGHHSHMIARHRMADHRAVVVFNVQHLFSGSRLRNHVFFWHDKTITCATGHQQSTLGFMHKNVNDFSLIWQIHHQPNRLTHATSARQIRRAQRVEPPVGAKHQKPVRRLRMEDKSGTVTVFELQLTRQINVTGHSPNPAHLRANNGDRFPINHRLNWHLFNLSRLREHRTPRATFIVFPEGFLGLFQLLGNALPLQIDTAQKRNDSSAFFQKHIAFTNQFQLFQTSQTAQSHIENCLGLHLSELRLAGTG
mmetsp:Transcript_2452/g.4152  ORF Transcript_2452/g.4152 Transcript_2452/m.4152 type:complete len:399 (-) Transcript_2452:1366-2562(-)